jgi:hypothetical protein
MGVWEVLDVARDGLVMLVLVTSPLTLVGPVVGSSSLC